MHPLALTTSLMTRAGVIMTPHFTMSSIFSAFLIPAALPQAPIAFSSSA
jgi:hypothetical protein